MGCCELDEGNEEGEWSSLAETSYGFVSECDVTEGLYLQRTLYPIWAWFIDGVIVA